MKNLIGDNEKMEIWKAINGYQGLYEISNYGRVKALAKVIQRETKRWVKSLL